MIFSRPSSDEIASFYRQTAVLLRAGLSLPDAVCALRYERDLPKIRGKLAQIQKDLARSVPLEDCFASHPALFSPALIRAFSSGIPGEKVAEIFEKFADTEEKTARVGGKITSILAYPAAVILVAIFIMFVIIVFVIPVFKEMFADMGEALPPSTQLVIDISDVVHGYFLPIILCLVIAVVFLAINKKFFYASASRLPVIGISLRKIAISNFAEYFSLMLSVGIPLMEAWQSAAGSVKNLHYGELLIKMGVGVSDIVGLKEAMNRSSLFPVMLLTAMDIRPTPQALQMAMAETAGFYQAGMKKNIEKNLLLFEIMMMLVLGTIIGGLVIAMYLPIFKMAGNL